MPVSENFQKQRRKIRKIRGNTRIEITISEFKLTFEKRFTKVFNFNFTTLKQEM